MTTVRKVYVLLCGFEIMRKSISTRDKGSRFVMSEPVCAYLVEADSGYILLDAGFDPAHVAGPQDVQALLDRTGTYPPVVGQDHRIETQLTQIGVEPSQIAHLVLSHMHSDHTGFLKHLPHAKVSVQRQELEFALSGLTNGAFAPSDYDQPGVRWNLVEGDWEVVPGLRMITTPGHTRGHQSAVITLPSGQILVLPFDAGDLRENFDLEILPGESCDDDAALASIRRIKAIVEDHQALMLLFHDPVAIQTIKLAPDYYS